MQLSVVVPASDDPPTLARCVAAIEASLGPSDEVIVVTEPAFSSPADARNRGADHATGDVLVFVDADVLVHDDALARIRNTLIARPGVTAVFGTYDDAPAVDTRVSAFRNLLHHHVHTSAPGPAETFWTGLGAIRREPFLAIGGFDGERYTVPSIEDVELGIRLVAAGHRVELVPEVRGTHLKRWTLRGMLVTDLTRRGVPWVELLLRERRSSSALNLGWRHRISALASVVAVLAALGRHPRVVAAAFLGLVGLNRSFYGLLAQRLGALGAVTGVGLHALHHLAAAAAVPLGTARHLRARARS